jgi:Cu/Ag efflux pump CusA
MRLSLFIFLLVLGFSTSGCKKLMTFTLDYSTELTIPSQAGINLPFNLYSPEVVTNSSARFESEGTSTKHLRTVYLGKLSLHITSPSSANFDFLNEIQIYISAPGVEEKLIAEKKNIPENQLKSLECDVKTVDLKEFIIQEYYELRVRTVTDQLVMQDVTIRADQEFIVEAKLL